MNAKELETALQFIGCEIKKMPGRRIAALGNKKIFWTFEGDKVAYCEARYYQYLEEKPFLAFRWHEIHSIKDAITFLS